MNSTLKHCYLALIICTFSCAKKTRLPSTQKVAEITYSINIKGLIESKCGPCHLPSQGGKKTPLDSYEATKTFIDPILKRVQLPIAEKGFMPLKGKALSVEEITLLKKWKGDGTAQ